MGCGAKAEASEARLLDQRPGTGGLRGPRADPDRQLDHGPAPRCGADRPDRHAGADRADEADEERRDQGRSRSTRPSTTRRSRSASISSDNIQGGAKAADALAKLIGDKGSVVVMNEQPGVSTTEQRIQGFIAGDQEVPEHQGADHPVRGRQPDQGSPGDHLALRRQPGPVRRVRHQRARRPGRRHRPQDDRYGQQSQDRRLRRRPHPGIGPQERRRPGARSPRSPTRRASTASSRPSTRCTGKPTKSILTGLQVLTKDNLAQMSKFIYKSSC